MPWWYFNTETILVCLSLLWAWWESNLTDSVQVVDIFPKYLATFSIPTRKASYALLTPKSPLVICGRGGNRTHTPCGTRF